MKKVLLTISTLLLALCCILAVGCGNNTPEKEITGITFTDATYNYDGTEKSILISGTLPEGVSVSYQDNKGTNVGVYNATATLSGNGYKSSMLTATLTINKPTAKQFVVARKNAIENPIIGYDFKLSLNANLALSKISGKFDGVYDGKYRYNKDTNKTSFTRTTSGLLLFDSTEYVYTSGTTKVLLKTDKNGEVKKLSTIPAQEEEISLVNLPFVKIVDCLQESNITEITETTESDYKFSASVNLQSSNETIQKVFSLLGKLGTNVSIKTVSFTNPGNFPILFNLENNKITDFKIMFNLSFKIKAVSTTLTLTYQQKGNNTEIAIPTVKEFTTDTSGINTILTKVNNAITSVKSQNTYSTDVTARNEFDPGFLKLATTDIYKARLYKNTYKLSSKDFTAFNHSYEYKTHHEEEGAETYKYTIGNIQDGTTHIVSRKGTNTVTEKSGVSANTQFDYLTGPFFTTSSKVDCIKTVTKGTKTTYYISLNAAEAVNVQNKINAYINSNDAAGVIKVNNYFDNDDYTIKSAIMEVTFENNVLTKIETETEIRYTPTGGEYTETRITLTDKLTLEINNKYNAAADYEAPSSTGKVVGLASAGHYIL